MTVRTKRRKDNQAVLASSLRNRGGAPATMASMSFREAWRSRNAAQSSPAPAAAPAPPKASRAEGDAQRQSQETSSPMLARAIHRMSSFGLTSWQESSEVAETLPLKKERLRNSLGNSTEGEAAMPASSHGMVPSVATPVRNLVGYSNSPLEKESSRSLGKVPLLVQFEEFVRRGSSAIPRSGAANATAGGAQPPCRNASFQHRLTAWSRQVGLPPELAPILLAEGRAHQGLAPGPPDFEQGVEVAVAWQVRILWRGVAVEILLEGGVDAGAYPAATGEAVAAEAAASAVLAGARTDCRWHEARLSVASAAERALGRHPEAFLDALHDMWCELTPGGEILTPRPGAFTVASPSETVLSRSTEDGDDDESLGPSFGEFLAERPPLWRFDNFSRGLAWDYPQSKAEKRELLLLQLLAEAKECDTELETVRRDSLLPPARS